MMDFANFSILYDVCLTKEQKLCKSKEFYTNDDVSLCFFEFCL